MKRLCPERGCSEPVAYRGRCRDHARQTNRRSHPNASFYSSKRWRMTSRHILHVEPFCRPCAEEGRETLATQVDHIKPMQDGGDPFDPENLQPICGYCHGRKTRKEMRNRLMADVYP